METLSSFWLYYFYIRKLSFCQCSSDCENYQKMIERMSERELPHRHHRHHTFSTTIVTMMMIIIITIHQALSLGWAHPSTPTNHPEYRTSRPEPNPIPWTPQPKIPKHP